MTVNRNASNPASLSNKVPLLHVREINFSPLLEERDLLVGELKKQCREYRIPQKEILSKLGLPGDFLKQTHHFKPGKPTESDIPLDRPKPIITRRTTQQGYIQIFIGIGKPGANKNGWILEHRKVMADQLGRPLESWEIVHHRNRIKSDNGPANLVVLTSVDHPTCLKCPYYLELQALKAKYGIATP